MGQSIYHYSIYQKSIANFFYYTTEYSNPFLSLESRRPT